MPQSWLLKNANQYKKINVQMVLVLFYHMYAHGTIKHRSPFAHSVTQK